MTYEITAPGHISSTVSLPASKSISNRALIIHAIAGGDVLPDNLSDCDDTSVVIAALKNRPDTIDIKAAGTAMRFMTALIASTPGTDNVITGTERMLHRPIGVLVDALRMLGADIEYAGEEGFPPLRIRGRRLRGGRLEMPGNVSSQYISALMLVAPTFEQGLTLRLTGSIVSRPYIDLTRWTMLEFGVKAEWTDVDTVQVMPQAYKPHPYLIENDWSAASYWYEIMALGGGIDDSVTLTGLFDGSRQGDAMTRYIFSLLGVRTSYTPSPSGGPGSVTLRTYPARPPRLDYDFTNCPDLAQTMTVACAVRDVPFRFTGLSSLRIKETDRIAALEKELRKLGYVLHDSNDSILEWSGERCDPTFEPVDTYQDHRMAMSFAPAAFVFKQLKINNPEVVSKSYPRYWDDLRSAGFIIKEV